MLKKSPNVVLGSSKSSTYPRGYASSLTHLRPSWMPFLSILQECTSASARVKALMFWGKDRWFGTPKLKLVSKFHDVHVHAETGRSVETGIGEVLGTKPGKGV